MEQMTRALGLWLNMHNLPTEGVKVTIEFRSEAEARQARLCLQRELNALRLRPSSETEIDWQNATMNGFGLSLRSST